jgi:hypothetical protein
VAEDALQVKTANDSNAAATGDFINDNAPL